MAAPYSDLESKLEKALKAYLATQNLGTTNIYTGEGNTDLDLPCILCTVESGPELEANTGIYSYLSHIRVLGQPNDGKDPKAAHDTLVARTFDAIRVSNLAAILNFYGTDLTVQGVTFGQPSRTQNPDVWENMQQLTLIACAQYIP